MNYHNFLKVIFILLLLSLTTSFCSHVFITTSHVPYEKDNIMTLFEEWLVKQHKTYNNFYEKEKRFKIFMNNLKIVNEHNSNINQTYKLGLNKFADLTFEEFSTIYLNPNLVEDTFKNKLFKSSNRYQPNVEDVLPPSVDWRKRGAVTEIKNQGQCGVCWIFSGIAAVEGINKIVMGNLSSLSDQEVLDCTKPLGKGCEGGLPDDVFQFIIRNGGIDIDKDYSYRATKNQCNLSKKMKKIVSIDSFEHVPRNNENALKKAVANQVVSVCIQVGNAFQLYDSGVFTGSCGEKLNHAVAIVGYGRSGEGVDYWIVKNSWGPNWGENGYIRFQRNVAAIQGKCAIAIWPSYPIKYRRQSLHSQQ